MRAPDSQPKKGPTTTGDNQCIQSRKPERHRLHKGDTYGCFYELEDLLVGVLIMRALLFAVYVRAPDFWKLPIWRSMFICKLFFSCSVYGSGLVSFP